MSTDFVPELITRPGARPSMSDERRHILRYNTRRGVSNAETSEQQAARYFAASTRNHEMTILHDDGVYRHIRCAAPGTGIWSWNLVTWPGHLAIGGDLESFTFSREHDMFDFFRLHGEGINPRYWAEKITNHDARKATRKFDERKATRAVVEEFLAQRHHIDGPAADAWLDLRLHVIDEIHSFDESLFHDAVNGWGCDGFEFTDTYEWDVQDWNCHYLYACHAIAWGVAKYREAKAEQRQAQERLARNPQAVAAIDNYFRNPEDVVADAARHTAGRDAHGNIRLDSGRSLLVAHAAATRDEVQGWHDRATDDRRRRQYAAALALFDREAAA